MKSLSGVVLRTQPDETLLTLAAAGSEPAFEALVHRYRRPLYAYCRRLLVSDARSEDVIQQSLLNAWQALRAGTEVREPRAWLYRITHNQAMSALRRPEYDFSELEDSLQVADAPESDLERRTLMRETLAAVAALPQRQQEVILRTAIEGQSYEQVAAALGLSSDAVRGLAHRARTSLRAALAAVTPGPIVVWAAERAGPAGSGPAWLATLGSTGGVGGAAAMIKGATLLASTAAIVGGTVSGVVHIPSIASGHHAAAHHHPAAHSSRRSASAATVIAAAQKGAAPGAEAARSVAVSAVRTGGFRSVPVASVRRVSEQTSSSSTTSSRVRPAGRTGTTPSNGSASHDPGTAPGGGDRSGSSGGGQAPWSRESTSGQPSGSPSPSAGSSPSATQSSDAPRQANAFPTAASNPNPGTAGGTSAPGSGGGGALGSGDLAAAPANRP
jgi:RNA polymerase sigma factor (sigma-70 family)